MVKLVLKLAMQGWALSYKRYVWYKRKWLSSNVINHYIELGISSTTWIKDKDCKGNGSETKPGMLTVLS